MIHIGQLTIFPQGVESINLTGSGTRYEVQLKTIIGDVYRKPFNNAKDAHDYKDELIAAIMGETKKPKKAKKKNEKAEINE